MLNQESSVEEQDEDFTEEEPMPIYVAPKSEKKKTIAI